MEEMISRTKEVVKALQKVKESKEKEKNIYEGQLVDPLEALRTGIKVPHSQLNPQKAVQDGASVDDEGSLIREVIHEFV